LKSISAKLHFIKYKVNSSTFTNTQQHNHEPTPVKHFYNFTSSNIELMVALLPTHVFPRTIVVQEKSRDSCPTALRCSAMALARSKPATRPPFLPRSCLAYPSLYKTCATTTLWAVCPSLCASRKIFTLIIWSVSRVSSNSSDFLFVGSLICWDCVWETVPLARSCGVALGAGSNSGEDWSTSKASWTRRWGGFTQRLCRWRCNLRVNNFC